MKTLTIPQAIEELAKQQKGITESLVAINDILAKQQVAIDGLTKDVKHVEQLMAVTVSLE